LFEKRSEKILSAFGFVFSQDHAVVDDDDDDDYDDDYA